MCTDVSEERIISETSVHIRTTRRYIHKNRNINNHRCENLKSYMLRFVLKSFLDTSEDIFPVPSFTNWQDRKGML
jgi:hypothetical protein